MKRERLERLQAEMRARWRNPVNKQALVNKQNRILQRMLAEVTVEAVLRSPDTGNGRVRGKVKMFRPKKPEPT